MMHILTSQFQAIHSFFGFENDGSIPNYKGAMDDIRMYNRTLSDEEVSELFNECYYGFLILIIFIVARHAIAELVISVLHVKMHFFERIYNVIKSKNNYYLIAV